MIVGVLRETGEGETRVALSPQAVGQLVKMKVEVKVEAGAGKQAGFEDEAFKSKGATIGGREEVLGAADVLFTVRLPGVAEGLKGVKNGALVMGHCDPLAQATACRNLVEATGISLIAMELIPRITRAQAMDTLSSQANLGGYKAVVMAANYSPKIFPMMMTAAGTLQSAKVFVIGAGVAGLQAIATAKRLGAVVSAYDVRPAVKEQVQSVGAKFVELPLDTSTAQDAGGYAKEQSAEQQRKQQELMAKVVAESDVVITTAMVPGKPAPKLIPAAAVAAMQPGSVIVDMAAAGGGNCELTEPGKIVVKNGVTIIGLTNLPATVPLHASAMLANNMVKLLALMVDKEGKFAIKREDEVIAGSLVGFNGEIVHPKVREILGLPALAPAAANKTEPAAVGGKA
jgi:H+-translocating NAD(P) transhydrogenase subunit alpha